MSTLITAITISCLETIRLPLVCTSVPGEAVESKLVIQTTPIGFPTEIHFTVDDEGIECLKLCPGVL